MQFKIVADSSSDILDLTEVPFATAPLMIFTAEREFVDNAKLDVGEMVDHVVEIVGRGGAGLLGAGTGNQSHG